MSKLDDLRGIEDEIIENNVCPELAEQAQRLVFGEGNADAQVVFIGEAPGKKEDELGLPFVGAAGKFLDEMLQSIQLKREDIYITNIVKYRPPNNRDPSSEEKTAFWPYLVRQLKVIKPKLVVTLGRHSMDYFLPNKKIGQIHGQPENVTIGGMKHSQSTGGQQVGGVQGDSEARTESYGQYGEGALELSTQQSPVKLVSASGSDRRQDELVLTILPLYHPAAALYNGSQRQILMDDFAKIPQLLNQIEL